MLQDFERPLYLSCDVHMATPRLYLDGRHSRRQAEICLNQLRGETGRGPPKMVVRLRDELALVFVNHETFVLSPQRA